MKQDHLLEGMSKLRVHLCLKHKTMWHWVKALVPYHNIRLWEIPHPSEQCYKMGNGKWKLMLVTLKAHDLIENLNLNKDKPTQTLTSLRRLHILSNTCFSEKHFLN